MPPSNGSAKRPTSARPAPARAARIATNLDAALIARRPTGKRVGLVIEWKHTETYTSASYAVSRGRTDRVARYSKRLLDPAGPIDSRKLADLRDLFHDPFLQLTRQALLAWRLAEDDGLFDDWVHLHVIPPANRQLIGTVTAPKLTGATMPDAFAGVLRKPSQYRHVSPTQLLSLVPAYAGEGWRTWLAARYAT